MNKLQQLERLTVSRVYCEKLVALGIIPWAVLWHMAGDDGSEGAKEEWAVHWSHFPDEEGAGDYLPGICVPAWTKDEIDVLIGPEFPKADLVRKPLLSSRQDPNQFSAFLPSRRFDAMKAADCAAIQLLFLLGERMVKAEEANKRFLDVFQLVENGLINLSVHPKFPL